MARKSKQAAVLLSLEEVARITNHSATTIRSWVDKLGFPYVERGDQSTGKSWAFSMPEIISWFCERAVTDALEKAGPRPDGGAADYETARAREKWAKAYMAEVELDEMLGRLVDRHDAQEIVAREYALIRAAIEAAPDRIAPRILGKRKVHEVRAVVREEFRSAIEGLSYDQDLASHGVRGRRRRPDDDQADEPV